MRIFKFTLVSMMFALLLVGCEGGRKEVELHRQNIRFSELMPKGGPQYTGKLIAGLSITMFEVDSGSFPRIQAMLNGGSNLQTNYAENEFNFGNGDLNSWANLESALVDANTAITQRTTIFINEGVTEHIDIAKFPQGTSVNYKPDSGTSAAIGLPAGNLTFDVSVKSLIGLKKVCLLEIKPVYQTLRKKIDDKKLPAWTYEFESLNFSSTIREGQFVFISPYIQSDAEKISALPSPGRMFFTDSRKEKRVKFCLIVCGLIKD